MITMSEPQTEGKWREHFNLNYISLFFKNSLQKRLTSVGSYAMIKPWQRLALRLSDTAEGTPASSHISWMWNPLRI